MVRDTPLHWNAELETMAWTEVERWHAQQIAEALPSRSADPNSLLAVRGATPSP